MKQIDVLTDRLFEETMNVLNGRVSPKNGLASASMADTVIRAAVAHSNHQKLQKKVPHTRLFDKEFTQSQLKDLLKVN